MYNYIVVAKKKQTNIKHKINSSTIKVGRGAVTIRKDSGKHINALYKWEIGQHEFAKLIINYGISRQSEHSAATEPDATQPC